jgi:hypothetical protein
MPAPAHEIPLQLLRETPGLLVALLQKLGHPAPSGPLVIDDANLRFADPAEVRPDLVFRADSPPWVIFELQNRIDEDKGRRWVLAVGIKLNETGAMGDVIVLTSSRRVEKWAKQAAVLRSERGTVITLAPLVLLIAGDVVEALLDEEHPELAFFAAWAVRARSSPEAGAIVARAGELTERLPESLREAAQRAILGVLCEPMLAYLKKASMNPDQIPETRAARRFRLFFEERGKTEGLTEGLAKGKTDGLRQALLVLIGARGMAVSDEERAAIDACADAALLDQWVARAATAGSTAEVLRAPVRRRAAAARPKAIRR